jgi:hypothetical protein
MRFSRLNAFIVLSVFCVLPSAARADYYLWRDADSGLTISFPDTWKVQNNAKPDDIITVMGPSDNDQPVCKVTVHDDRRYVIFPPEYGRDVQKVAVSTPFWKQYLGEYDGYDLNRVYDGGGLGRWHASYALASYKAHLGTVMQTRRAIMFASLYNDKLYILECSSLNHAYEAWAPMFQSIVKSVDFKKAYHELPIGEYANFLKGADLYFWSQTGPDGTVGY